MLSVQYPEIPRDCWNPKGLWVYQSGRSRGDPDFCTNAEQKNRKRRASTAATSTKSQLLLITLPNLPKKHQKKAAKAPVKKADEAQKKTPKHPKFSPKSPYSIGDGLFLEVALAELPAILDLLKNIQRSATSYFGFYLVC